MLHSRAIAQLFYETSLFGVLFLSSEQISQSIRANGEMYHHNNKINHAGRTTHVIHDKSWRKSSRFINFCSTRLKRGRDDSKTFTSLALMYSYTCFGPSHQNIYMSSCHGVSWCVHNLFRICLVSHLRWYFALLGAIIWPFSIDVVLILSIWLLH